jgi:hypothetical protein
VQRKLDSRYGDCSDPGIRRRRDVRRRPTRAQVHARRGRTSKPSRPIRPSPVKFNAPEIFDNYPQTVPVAQRELDVIECYLSELLDEALGRPG